MKNETHVTKVRKEMTFFIKQKISTFNAIESSTFSVDASSTLNTIESSNTQCSLKLEHY
jgi:hypothetical protein